MSLNTSKFCIFCHYCEKLLQFFTMLLLQRTWALIRISFSVTTRFTEQYNSNMTFSFSKSLYPPIYWHTAPITPIVNERFLIGAPNDSECHRCHKNSICVESSSLMKRRLWRVRHTCALFECFLNDVNVFCLAVVKGRQAQRLVGS